MDGKNQEPIESLHAEIQKLTTELKSLQKSETAVSVGDYRFSSSEGELGLVDLFGDQGDLIVTRFASVEEIAAGSHKVPNCV